MYDEHVNFVYHTLPSPPEGVPVVPRGARSDRNNPTQPQMDGSPSVRSTGKSDTGESASVRGDGEGVPGPPEVGSTSPDPPHDEGGLATTGADRVSVNPAFGYAAVVRDSIIGILPLSCRNLIPHSLGAADSSSVVRGLLHVCFPAASGAHSIVFATPPPEYVNESNPLGEF